MNSAHFVFILVLSIDARDVFLSCIFCCAMIKHTLPPQATILLKVVIGNQYSLVAPLPISTWCLMHLQPMIPTYNAIWLQIFIHHYGYWFIFYEIWPFPQGVPTRKGTEVRKKYAAIDIYSTEAPWCPNRVCLHWNSTINHYHCCLLKLSPNFSHPIIF